MPDLEARWILKDVLRVTDSDLISGTCSEPSAEQVQRIDSIVRRRARGEPLSRILGEREFFGRKFILTPETLDPRPDTEVLVRCALDVLHVKQEGVVLDLGTGTGCILITLLAECPDLRGVGVDLSQGAVDAACRNAKIHNVSDRVEFIQGDWSQGLDDMYDLVVSNPPYIASPVIATLDKEVRNHDPILALDGGEDGLQAYKKIFSDLKRVLKPGGKALFEIGFDQEADVVRLSKDSRIRVECVHRDTAGRPRVVEMSRGDN